MSSITAPLETVDYHTINQDFTGSRRMKDQTEFVEYRKNSTLRIWLNNLPTDFDIHTHSAIEIIVPCENDYKVVINSVEYHVEPDEIFMIPPRAAHAIKAPEKGYRFIYLFELTFLSRLNSYSEINSLLTKPLHITRETHPEIHEEILGYLIRIRNLYFEDKPYSDFTIYAQILEMFTVLFNNRIRQIENNVSINEKSDNSYAKKFQYVMNYIDTHYMEDLTLENIAHSIGFSKYHFSRLFRQYTNYTFCDYLNYRRIQIAIELLSDPELSITEIALRSGFSSISTFNRLFKQSTNCSPTEFRSLSTDYKHPYVRETK